MYFLAARVSRMVETGPSKGGDRRNDQTVARWRGQQETRMPDVITKLWRLAKQA